MNGAVALVTGASSGIGAALCAELERRGARVIRADLKASTGVEQLDVRDAAAFRRVVEGVIAREGRLDYLFNNAGIGAAGEVRDLELEDWRPVMEVNYWGVVHGVAAAYPVMLRQGFGHIVNTASGAGLLPRPGMTPYAATKHAVVGLTLSLRAEAARFGVKVSAACPGFVSTDIMNSASYKKMDGAALRAAIPVKPISAETCARRILDGVAADRALITTDSLLRLEWLLFRLSPALGLRMARFRGDRMSACRAAA